MNSAYQLLRAVLLVLWPPVVVAATQVTLDNTFNGISPLVWVIVMVLATMGGLTSLLHRLKTEIPQRMTLYVTSHMVMAWFAGLAAFFIFELIELNDLLEIPMIGVASYSGARMVDTMTERLAKWVDNRLDKLFG